ncbi:MAG TPA: bifunctional aspartate kinase/homoserine dehydrogenase I [Steroidobacteraceae bacterium]|nr:bifunctional aspartate kinase/homoserine dehydrogenase I [Steroidobacteraceae bacterium]
MTASDWIVHKFGGSSVADADCFRRVADILESHEPGRLGVVLSACRGVTDMLLGLVALAEAQDGSYAARLADLRARHVAIAGALLKPESAARYIAQLDAELRDIEAILQSVRLIRAAAENIRDLIAGFGEIWSTRLFGEFLRERGKRPGEVRWLDARRVVVVDWGSLGPAVDWNASQRNFDALVEKAFDGTLIITGFIARNRQGIQTTLGRNGSDFSGSIFGALCHARAIHIWTDVDGVLSADPRLVPDAQVIDSLSYNEAMELAYFGAKVIHPQTMAPAISRRIPIYIRNTFAAAKPGTLICAEPDSKLKVKGITSIDNIALVNLEGAGMIGVPGTAHRLFGALRDEQISVILISQGSSEHSICFAIPEAQATRAEDVVRRAFDSELRQGQIQRVEVSRGSSILAVVGDGMAGAHGVAAKVFGTLGSSGVNVRAIAQGASERNISVVIDGRDAARALRGVHAGFYLSPHTISIGVIGPGTVGSVLIDQIAGESERLRREFKLDLRVRGILTSKRMYLASGAIDLTNWRDRMTSASEPTDLARFVSHLHAAWLPHTILIDCTASAEIAGHYRGWLAAGIHVVTPNKKANSAALSSFRAVQEARRATGAHYLYEATVGAGLPIITTVRDLRETGDRIRSVEGLLSGTLAYLFNVYDGREPFSSIVKAARAKGYTEPDPRDDLSGLDVARKLIILGREMGLPLEMQDVVVESLVPAALTGCSIDEFLERMPQYDAAMLKRFEAAQAKGKLLRYVGRLDAGGAACVGLVELDARHSFANIALTDNVVRFVTDRYCDNPLVVQGPGAGPAVTAAGVFADLLRVSAYLGTKL